MGIWEMQTWLSCLIIECFLWVHFSSCPWIICETGDLTICCCCCCWFCCCCHLLLLLQLLFLRRKGRARILLNSVRQSR